MANETSNAEPANASGSGNTLSLSLPTDFMGGGNGLNLSFNFGGNGTTIANSAYNFLNNSFANQQSFLGNSINGTQQFLSNQVAPLLNVTQSLGQTFNTMMPDIVHNLFGAATQANQVSEQISANATAASEAASQASIAESNKASGGGGLCFITTAVCETMMLSDDCHVLTTLRHFRDTYMMEDADKQTLVKLYYDMAPGYVKKISARSDAWRIYARMYTHFIVPAVDSIESGDNAEALALYVALVSYARSKANER